MTRIDLEAKQPPEIRRPTRQPEKPGLSVDDKFLKGATLSETLKAHQDDFDAVLRKGTLKDRLEATRRLRELSGGKAHVLKRLEKSPITEQNASALGHIAALAGERDVFNKCASKTSIDSKLALELACEGGHPDIINKVSEKTGKTVLDHGFFEDPPWKKLPKSGYSVLLTQFENKPVEEQVKALRALLELPGGKDFLKEHLAEPTRPSEQVALAAALAGDFELFQASFNSFGDNLASAEFDGENLLHLACQGGNADIIKMVAEIKKQADPNKNPLLTKRWFKKKPIDYLDRSLIHQKFQDSEQTLSDFYNDNIREQPGGKTLAAEMQQPSSWLDRLPRFIIEGVRNFYARYKRQVTRGESAPAKEDLMAAPTSPAKKVLYDYFARLDPTEDARELETLRNSLKERLKQSDPLARYLEANTFHFLGGLVEKGEFDLAKQMIDEGLYNEVSPRLLSALETISPLRTEQQLELCKAFFKKSEVLEERVLLIRHLMSIPGGAEIAQRLFHEAFPEATLISVNELIQGLSLSALLGDHEKFKELFERDINPSVEIDQKPEARLLNLESIKNFKTANGETLMHFACEGGDPELIKLFADKLDNDPSYFLKETESPGWFWGTLAGWLFEDKNRPIDFMTLGTANELDQLYGHDRNKPGSFSIAVVKSIYIRKPLQSTYEIASRLSALSGGRVGIHTFMSLASNIDTYSQSDAFTKGLTHFADLGGRQTTAEKPLLSKSPKAARLEQSILTELYRKYVANGGKGLDDSLAQFAKKKPLDTEPIEISPTPGNPEQTQFESALANRIPRQALHILRHDAHQRIQINEALMGRLSRVPYIDPATRQELVYHLITQAQDDVQKPDDGNTQVEALLESQITAYPSETNQAIYQAIVRHLENPSRPPSVGKLRSYMIAAARMKDRDLLEKITQKANDPASLWLDTFVRRKMRSPTGFPQLGYGNTLMHVACTTGDVAFIQYAAQNMVAAYMSRSLQAKPGESLEHRLPTVTIAQKVSVLFSGETGRRWRDLPINPFDMRNASGETAAEILAPSIARVMDEVHGVTPLSPGSLSQISISYLDALAKILGIELGMLLPGKVGITLSTSRFLAQALAAGGVVAGLAHAGPVGMFATEVAVYLIGMGTAVAGGVVGSLSGEGGLKALERMRDTFQGYQKEASSIQPEMLEQAKAAFRIILKSCGPEDQINRVFAETPIREPQDLVQLLENMGSIPDFKDRFVEMISRTSLVRTGRVSKEFMDALERQPAQKLDEFDDYYLDMHGYLSMPPKERKNELASIKEQIESLRATKPNQAVTLDAKLKLFQEIDTYLSTGLKLSHQQIWNLSSHLNARHPTSS